MTQVDTKKRKRYTLREVQQLATTYDLLVQPLTARTYGIFFEGQLIAQATKLVDVVATLPDFYRAIQEQLAEQQKEIAPVVSEAIALVDSVAVEEELYQTLVAQNADTEHCAGCDTKQILENPEELTTGKFSHHFYENATNWEWRQELNDRGYKDAIAHYPPLLCTGPYMAGYNRGIRDA